LGHIQKSLGLQSAALQCYPFNYFCIGDLGWRWPRAGIRDVDVPRLAPRERGERMGDKENRRLAPEKKASNSRRQLFVFILGIMVVLN